MAFRLLLLIQFLFMIETVCANSLPFNDREGIPEDTIGLRNSYVEYLSEREKCLEEMDSALSRCNEESNSEYKSSLKTMGAIADGLGPVITGMMDACSKLAETFKVAQGAMAGFRMQCALQKDSCESACSKAKKEFAEFKEIYKKYRDQPTPQNADQGKKRQWLYDYSNKTDTWISEQENKKTDGSYAHAVAKCADQQKVLQSATQNLASFGVGMLRSSTCKNELNAAANDVCKTYPTLPSCSNSDIDCTIESNKNNQVCICQENPRDPVCSGNSRLAATNLNFDGGGASGGPGDGSNLKNKKDDDSFNVPTGMGDFSQNQPAGSGSGGSTASGGGSSLGGSGSGLSGAGGGGDGSGGGSTPYDTSVGFAGGGGGGYGSYSGYSRDSGSKSRKPSAYSAYLPGGALDPKKGKLGSDGLTGSHGPSLFDKIGARYRDNRGTLIND